MADKHVHQFVEHVATPELYKNGRRYILARKCECGAKQAYDLVHELPKERNKDA